MNTLQAVNTLLGGVGLFLVGMWLMTDGLKLAAGRALRDLLFTWTNTRLRGLGTGFMITGLVQSSSAVTVATIGFANAGLLSLEQAVWVIYGSNVGTTMTGWIVVLIGFNVNMEYLALPLIGIGMLLRLTGSKTQRAAIGQALVGFGLFFLGISVLKDGFAVYATQMSLPPMQGSFFTMLPLYLALGLVLTTLMQSSSAAMVITLGAAATGLIPLGSAAAVVIGANLGTTTTAVIAVIGATSTAKRVAASHVLFNLITAFAAVLILVPMLQLTAWLRVILHMPDAPATTLALFHTVFNILGVLLMWPLTARLTSLLQKRFISIEEMAGRPAYLDNTSLTIPAVAMEALLKELDRLRTGAILSVKTALGCPGGSDDGYADPAAAERLAVAIGEYVSKLNSVDLPKNVAGTLPTVIQVAQQYVLLCSLAAEIQELQDQVRLPADVLPQREDLFKDRVAAVFDLVDTDMDEAALARLQDALNAVEEEYESLKSVILDAASRGRVNMVTVDAQLQQNNLMRRMARQIVKAANRVQYIRQEMQREDITGLKPEAETA